MTNHDIQQLYEYDRWANNRVLQAATTLSNEQFTRDLGGSFRSLRDTLVHIIAGEWGWLTFWKGPRGPNFAAELTARRAALFDPSAFPTIAAVKAKWAEVENEQIEFVGRLTNQSLAEMIPARGTELSLEHLMQHVANHSSYHRGQVALMMRQLGAVPVPTDFHVFLAERKHAAVAGS